MLPGPSGKSSSTPTQNLLKPTETRWFGWKSNMVRGVSVICWLNILWYRLQERTDSWDFCFISQKCIISGRDRHLVWIGLSPTAVVKRPIPELQIALRNHALVQGCNLQDAEIELFFSKAGLFLVQLQPLIVQLLPLILKRLSRRLTEIGGV